MRLFDILFGFSKNIDTNEQHEFMENIEETNTTVDRRSIPASKIDEMQKIEASERYRNKVYKKYYSNYPEKPFISKDRELNTNWIEQAEMFLNQSIIPISMMTRYDDGLLPGHVYMLYWLKKYTNKRVPTYFEYKYGIKFGKEKKFLYKNGYLNDMDKPTEKGEAAITEHYEVIKAHTPPKPDRSIEGISKQIIAQRDNIERNGFKGYTFHANRDCCNACAALNGKHFPVSKFKIGVNAPPIHDGCRCSISAYDDDSDYEAWLDHLAKGGTTKEWNKRKRK